VKEQIAIRIMIFTSEAVLISTSLDLSDLSKSECECMIALGLRHLLCHDPMNLAPSAKSRVGPDDPPTQDASINLIDLIITISFLRRALEH
jgi:hypothetical protein